MKRPKKPDIQKVRDKSVNLDVQGQGCWDDCVHPSHWENNTSSKSCVWTATHYSPKASTFF